MTNTFYILILSLAFLACQSAPLSIELEDFDTAISESKPSTCTSNSNSGDCTLLLLNITYDLPEKECQVYDILIVIDTKFKAPAGLEYGSTARIDWEFFPKGNAGFWTLPIEVTTLHEGIIRVPGCFTYGEQDTLKIRRSITDHDGMVSNEISIEIPRPKEKKSAANSSPSGFKVIGTLGEIN